MSIGGSRSILRATTARVHFDLIRLMTIVQSFGLAVFLRDGGGRKVIIFLKI